jgi:hypothetical protein
MASDPDSTGPPGRFLSRLTPARIVAFAVLASIPVKLLSDKLVDPDLWWHLKTGELIARDWIPSVDPFSYTVNGQPWVVQEWGAELILHGLRSAFGLYGILFYRAFVVLALYLIVARMMRRRMGSGIGTWALLGLTAYAGSANWTERPNLLSFLLFAATLVLIERKDNRIWLFIPIAALWANLHGMVVLGLGLVLLVAVTEWLKVMLRWPRSDRTWAMRLTQVAAMGILASLLNPYGPGLLTHAVRLIGLVPGFVQEWASPDFHEPGAFLFLVLLLITIGGLAFSPERKDPTDLALALAFTFLALQAVRNLTLSAIVIGLVAARYLPSALDTIPRRQRDRQEVSAGSSALLNFAGAAITVLSLALVLVLGFPASDAPEDILDESYPVAAIDALDRQGVRVFALDGWAPLVIDRVWPNAHVYIDLRWDLYGERLSRNYRRIYFAHPAWDEELDRSCTTHVLMEPTAPIAEVLRLSAGWRVEREDDLATTFARVVTPAGCEAPIQD